MKKLVALAAAAFAACGAHAAAVDAMTNDPQVVVKSLDVRQRYPWNGKVDIDFTFTNAYPEAFAFINFKAEYVDKSGATVEVPMKTFEQVTLPWCTNAGTYHVTWDAAADAPNLTVTNLRYTVMANMAKYMVVDLSKGTSATADDPYPITYMEECPDPTRDDGGWTDEYKTTKMVFRLVQPGTYKKGWSTNFSSWHDTSAHDATITRPFYIAIFECTQGQAKQITGSYPGNQTYEWKGSIRDKRPVNAATYNAWRGSASAGYCWPNHGSKVSGSSVLGVFRTRTGNNEGFDMPTETEWEYMARAGVTDAWGGDGLTRSQKGVTDAGPTGNNTNTTLYAKGRYKFNGGYIDNGDGTYTAPAYTDDEHGPAIVGSYKPNAWGIYDTLGNVREWTLDYRPGGMDATATVDDMGADVADPSASGVDKLVRAVRGGNYGDAARSCSLVARPGGGNANVTAYAGCRIAWHFPFAGTGTGVSEQ